MLLSWNAANELEVSRRAESNGVGCAAATLRLSPSASLGASAKQGRLSRKAREVAHPQLFRSMFKDKSGLYFPVKVAHPPDSVSLCNSNYRNWCMPRGMPSHCNLLPAGMEITPYNYHAKTPFFPASLILKP